MAGKIPVYNRTESMEAPMNVARASTAASPNSPVAAAMGNLAQVGQQAVSTFGRLQQQEQENIGAVQVSNVLSDADVYWQENMSERFKAYKVGDGDMREAIGKDFDKWAAENAQKLPTEKSRQYFLTHAASMKSRLQTGAYSFQEKAVTNKLNADSAVGEQADENIVFTDATRYDEVVTRRIEPLLARTDIDEATKIKMADQYKRRMSLAVERGELERDPAAWYKRRFGTFDPGVGGQGAPSGGFQSAVEQVFKHEGGYSASDGNTGAPVNFGINQKANPDIDVKNLTKAEAAKIYKERYWDKIGGDNLPPALQGTAMDAAVNQGPENAKKWIAESGGDPTKFNALRRAHYEALLKDPDNAKFRKAWMGRLASYENGGSATAGAASGAAGTTQPKTFAGMDWEQQLQLKSLAETRLKQGEAMFKAGAERTLKDAIAMHNDGIVDKFNLGKEYFDRAFGAEGGRLFEEYTKSRDMGADIGRFKTQSAAEINAELQASKPMQGEGYAAEDQRYQTRQRAAAAVMEQRKKDPAGYATANSEALTRQRQEIDALPQERMAERSAMVQQYVRDSLAEQRRLGIETPQVLTPAQADMIAARATKAVRPEDSANLIAGLEAEYGSEFFPKVFDQLVKENKIAGELLIIPNLPSQAARESVSRLSRIKESDLSAGIDSAGQKQVKDAVTEKLGDFVRAIPYGTAQSIGVANSYETVMRKRAYELVQAGTKPAEAVEQAYNQVLGHYQFEGATRYPKGTNVSAAKSGAAYVLEKKLGDIDLPADLTGARKPEEVRAEWTRTVQSRPLWHTRDDDGGLELYAMGSNGTKYRVTRGGQPVSYSWAELETINKTAQDDSIHAGSGVRAKMRAAREASRQRIEATQRQVDNEDRNK
jgi:hypothetical protein